MSDNDLKEIEKLIEKHKPHVPGGPSLLWRCLFLLFLRMFQGLRLLSYEGEASLSASICVESGLL